MALRTNLVSYWRLDESSGNAADSTASANTLTNASVTYSAGILNNGAVFAAASSADLSHADNASLSIIGNISFSCWVKMSSQPALNSNMNLMAKWVAAGGQRSYQLSYLDASAVKKLEFRYTSNGAATSTIFQINQTLTTGTFYHIVVTATVATPVVTIYVNGVSVSGTLVDNSATAIFDGTGAFALGSLSSVSQYLDGMLDEVGIWSRALSGAEVTSLYNSGVPLYPWTSALSDSIMNGASRSVTVSRATTLVRSLSDSFMNAVGRLVFALLGKSINSTSLIPTINVSPAVRPKII